MDKCHVQLIILNELFFFIQIKRTVVTRVYEAVKALALCHNVTPVVDEDEPEILTEVNGHVELKETGCTSDIVYQASSPDEVFLNKTL